MMRHILQSMVFALCAVLTSLPTHAQQWVQVGQDIDGEVQEGRFGRSVSLSSDGSRLAIGEPGKYLYGQSISLHAGYVRVYDCNGSTWRQIGQDIAGEAQSDKSGWSVSLSREGSRVAIGATGNDGNGANAGHVRIYEWDGLSWVQLGQDIDGNVNDHLGYSVSLSSDGSRVAIGAYSPYGDASSAGGDVRIYEWDGLSWVQLGHKIDGEDRGDKSGYSISLSSDGSRVAIGAPYNDGIASIAGHVRVFDWDGLSWVQVGQDIDGQKESDKLGSSVSLSSDGSRMAIGAPGNSYSTHAGYVRVYDWNGSSWVQAGQDINGEMAYGQFGYSVCFSGDANRLAIGDPGNDGKDFNCGHVRIYDWNGSSWLQVGQDIDGKMGSGESGSSVSLSSDGKRVAIGAIYYSGKKWESGHVRIYEEK